MEAYNNIDGYIAEAIKEKDTDRLSTLRMIKAKFIEYRTSKDAKPMTDAIEVQLLKKMVHEREDAISMYIEGGRNELAEKERKEIEVIKEFLPKEVSVEEVAEAYRNVISSGVERSKKNMGLFIKKIKEQLPLADGKLVSTFVLDKLS